MSSSLNSSSSTEVDWVAALAPLSDVVCTVDVIVGSAHLSVRDCLALQPDSVVRLDQTAGGDMQVNVNGITLGRGEVVIVEDSTAIRITEILSPPSSEIDE